MAQISISNFKNAFNGGTRSNRFLVEGNIPQPSGSAEFSKFHIQTTTIPSVSSQRIQYEYFGRKAYYPGEKQYGPWSVIVLDDIGVGDMWKAFSRWHNWINDHVSNKSYVLSGTSDYKTDFTIRHLSLNGEESPNDHKKFILRGCWPKTIEPISFNMESANLLVKFSVIFICDYFEIPGVTNVGNPTNNTEP